MVEKTNFTGEWQDDQVVKNLRKHKITTLRYKVYIFILVVIIFFFRPIFVTSVEKIRGAGALDGVFSLLDIVNIPTKFLHQRGEEGGLLYEIDEIDKQMEETDEQILWAQREQKIIDRLNDEGKRNTITNCLNVHECDEIPEKLLPYLWLFRIYLLINDLEYKKMDFNQKLILKNINTFLIGQDGGVLSSISFWDVSVVNETYNIHLLPISLVVDFESREILMSFLHNLEERIQMMIPVFYRIKSMNYNIVNYEDTQQINVQLDAYYIAWLPREDENGTDNDEVQVEDTIE